MALFDKLNDFAKNIGDKTNEAIETGKLNSKINSEQNAAREELKKAGEYYYDKFTATGEADPEVLDFFQKAKAHFEAAAEAQAEIDRIKAENEAEKAAAQAAAQAEAARIAAAAPAKRFCSQCGAEVGAGMKFCSQCGNRMDQE